MGGGKQCLAEEFFWEEKTFARGEGGFQVVPLPCKKPWLLGGGGGIPGCPPPMQETLVARGKGGFHQSSFVAYRSSKQNITA